MPVLDILDATESGDAVVNDCTIHPLIPALPFGGVGNVSVGFGPSHWNRSPYCTDPCSDATIFDPLGAISACCSSF